MSSISTTILATSVFLTSFAGFGVGYLMSPPPARSGDSRPIIDPDAWNRTAPHTFPAPIPTAHDPAEGSAADAAAETDAPRGWGSGDLTEQAPSDFSDTGAELTGFSNSYAVEPLEGAATSDEGTSSITVLSEAEADRVWESGPHRNDSDQTPDSAASTTH